MFLFSAWCPVRLSFLVRNVQLVEADEATLSAYRLSRAPASSRSEAKESSLLAGRDVIYFIDNDSAMFACIKGFSDVSSSADMLRAIAKCNLDLQARSRFARVPI